MSNYESLRLDEALNLIINNVPIGVLLVDSDSKIVFSNSKAERILGFQEGGLLKYSVHDLVPMRLHEEHKKLFANYNVKPAGRAMNSGRMLPALKKDGTEVFVQLGLSPITIEESSYTLVSLIESNNQIVKVASYNDPLTGLPNRTLFNEISKNLRNTAIREKLNIAIMFIDIDNFKRVNDLYGHDVGDSLLCEISDALTGSLRKNDIVGRIGGDEFVACLSGLKNDEGLRTVADKLIHGISSIRKVSEHDVEVGASIGIILVKDLNDVSIDEMINKADKLMYKAKRSGKNKAFTQEYQVLSGKEK